jgi:hypothetical protein
MYVQARAIDVELAVLSGCLSIIRFLSLPFFHSAQANS